MRLADSPFFLLGLTPACSRIEVEREGQKLMAMLEVGMEEARRYVTPLGERERTVEQVRQAMADLRDPARRLGEELWAMLPAQLVPVAYADEEAALQRQPLAGARALLGFAPAAARAPRRRPRPGPSRGAPARPGRAGAVPPPPRRGRGAAPGSAAASPTAPRSGGAPGRAGRPSPAAPARACAPARPAASGSGAPPPCPPRAWPSASAPRARPRCGRTRASARGGRRGSRRGACPT